MLLKTAAAAAEAMAFCKNDSCGYRNVNILIRWLNSSTDKTEDQIGSLRDQAIGSV